MRGKTILVAGALALAGCGQFGGGADTAAESTGMLGQGAQGGGGSTDTDTGANGDDASGGGGNVLRLGRTNLCAAAAGNVGAANPNVVLSSCAGAVRQLWQLDQNRLRLADGRCLMAPALQLKSTQAVAVACDKVAASQAAWRLDAGRLSLAVDAGRCLSAPGQAAVGGAVAVVACDNGDAGQRWALQDVAELPRGVAPDDGNGALEPNSAGASDAGGSAATGGNAPAQQPNAAGGAATGSGAAAPTVTLAVNTATNDTSGVGGQPRSYSGPAVNFPNQPNRWDSWDNAWARASRQFPSSNTAAQSGWIRDAILRESANTGMDPRFILAVVMQESGGDVHVRTTNNGVNNPGLMQSHNGASFADVGDGGRASIFQMVQDGVEGTRDGDGLVQGVRQTKNYFAAGRLYNSGAIDNGNLSNALGATGSYCQDLANRVMGRM